MRFGLSAAIVLSASAGVSASAITCSVGQLFMRRRRPARTTTSSSTSKTPVCETEVEVAIFVLCVFGNYRDGIPTERIFSKGFQVFQNTSVGVERMRYRPFSPVLVFKEPCELLPCGP